ncbi:GNAT family N-acetyltransferase [Xanthomonas sp. MUS 060]|uniref:GNAT family N-acetyltransferase n=1 Tax=Xanthomonas sp. MUS 060 TaxID=1588031 RepID=UPI0005F2D2FC|nr:GNAT family N-acetyltransferase [Xanthomonas sp. MUS 060]
MPTPSFRLDVLDPARQGAELRALRAQAGCIEDPTDAAVDALGYHLLARNDDGQPIGSARLGADRRVGAMAVLPSWRGRGVGSALLQALLQEAQRRQWTQLELLTPPTALAFYARHGFLPQPLADHDHNGDQRLRWQLGASAVEDVAGAIAACTGILAQARRQVLIHSRALDPGLLDIPQVLAQLRRFAVAPHAKQVCVLLHDAATAQRASAPLLAMAQRLPSVFQFRAVTDPVDRNDATAYLVNEAGGYYFRPLGHRYEGEADLIGDGRARQLRSAFAPVWERARVCTELRALGW